MTGPVSIPPEEWEKLGGLMREVSNHRRHTAEEIKELRREHARDKADTDRKLDTLSGKIDRLTDHLLVEVQANRKQQESIGDVKLETFDNSKQIEAMAKGTALKAGGGIAAAVSIAAQALSHWLSSK